MHLLLFSLDCLFEWRTSDWVLHAKQNPEFILQFPLFQSFLSVSIFIKFFFFVLRHVVVAPLLLLHALHEVLVFIRAI